MPHSDRADEIGALARAIQIFQDAMGRNRNLASQVSQDSAAREQRARHIEQSVEAFREAIGAIMRGLSDNASVMRETAQTITRVTADASSRAGTAANATEQASHNVTAVAGAAEQTGQRTEKSISEIESLAAATQRIDGVLNLIQAIAEQTNLLALNATIEAARAGDAGRGFAVVAHEVKALAGQTAKATAEIGENVSMIQASTRNAVDAVREIGGAVREINDVTSAIAGAIGQQDAATREISSNAQSAAQGNETLVANITSLRDAIGETDTAAAFVLTAASSLTETADTLSREVEKFFQNLRSGAADSRIAKAG
ncbi:methyl-accepting chemotaxis protein [Bradyrhizobium japonicum]